MDATLWQRVKDVLGTALDLPEHERAAFLDSVCAESPELRAEVDSLLNAGRNATRFIETPGVAEHGHVFDEAVPDSGAAIGVYRVESQLGRGGMGIVYLASRSDGTYRRKVAIKVLTPGKGEGYKLALERFLREARAAAALDHPNIVRICDVARRSGFTIGNVAPEASAVDAYTCTGAGFGSGPPFVSKTSL